MHQIKYGVEVVYTDFDNSRHKKKYAFYASSESDADTIAREMFFMQYGVASDMLVTISPVLPSVNELDKVNRHFYETYGVLKDRFSSMNYKSFLKAYEDFEAKHLELRQDYASYILSFRGVTCKIIFNNHEGRVIFDEDEVVFRYDHRDYIIRNNLCDIFIGG